MDAKPRISSFLSRIKGASRSNKSSVSSIHEELNHLLEQCLKNPEHLSVDGYSIESLKPNIKQLETDWMFLNMFYMIAKREYDWEVFPPSLNRKIEDTASDIGSSLAKVAGKQNYLSRKPTPELAELIKEYQRKTQVLEAEIGKALDSLPILSFEFKGTPEIHDLRKSVKSLQQSNTLMGSINHPGIQIMDNFLDNYLELIEQLHDDSQNNKSYKHVYVNKNVSYSYVTSFDCLNAIRFLLKYVTTVAVRIELQSCSYWFNRKLADPARAESKLCELADLQYEIDPINPKFLEVNLNVLNAFRTNRPNLRLFSSLNFDFLRSILDWEGDSGFKKELMLLVAIVISNKLGNSCEAVQTFYAEIYAVLAEAASLSNPNPKPKSRLFLLGKRNKTAFPATTSLPELGINICLLKTEYFLKDQLNSSDFSMLYGKYIIKELNQIPEQLRKFSKDLHHEKREYSRLTLALVQDVNNEFASLRQSYVDKNCSTAMMDSSLLRLLLRIVIFKAEFFLLEFLKSNASAMTHEKVQVESLLEQLKVFHLILTNMLKEEPDKVEVIFTHIEAIARRITLFSYSFFPNEIAEGVPVLSFSELLDKAQHIKAKLKEVSPQFPMSNFPKTYKMGFVDFLSRNLGELLKYSPLSIAPLKSHIEEIRVHLKSLLMKLSDSDLEKPGVKDLRIIDVAYQVEHVIESIEVDAHWQHVFWLYDLLEELRLVDKQASSVQATASDATVHTVNSVTISDATAQTVASVTISDAAVRNANNVTQESHHMVSRNRVLAINEVVLDLKDEEEFIIDRLTRGSSQRDVVSITGMPGIGKTTLATKVYNSPQIKYHFHCLAWCTVSQVYEKRKLLLEIINCIQGLTGETRQMSTEDLELKLRRCLLRNKYLIVMDDVWSFGAWDDLKNSFPDDYNGSRILLISRQRSVALGIKPDSDPYCLRPFSVEESWKLLEMKVFEGKDCPKQLQMVGKEIAQRCQGLPLAVVAIAGLLRRTEKSQNGWTRVAESLSSQIINDLETQCMEIIELSYKYLPGHLKACFLYLGVFLEANRIPVAKVMRFWLAEGFIKTESKSLEEVAEEYLMNLIDRSLVIISKRRTDGKVKECRLHDLLRDFCWSKAKEEKFFQLVTKFDEPYASFPGSDNGIEFDYDYHLDPVIFQSYRLSIKLKRKHFIDSRPFGPGTRSLIFSAYTDSEPRCPYDISFISENFKALRVLDLECINIGHSFPAEIGRLVQLRYLAVSGFVQSIPESIGNLWKLETFVLQGLRGKVILPYTIWRMTSLRHLHVNNHVTFNLQDEKIGCSFQLNNLVSFSFPSLSFGENTEKILKRFLNLQKLKCIFLESWDSSKNCNQFPALNLLTHLESLKIVYYGRALNASEFILPSSLRQLTLSNFRLPWDHISAIGKLPNLEVLKLVSGAFEGQIWDMKEEEFQELKFLKLDTLDIAQWNATQDHLPKLQRLVLQNCKALQKVPDDFENITSLETIEVHWCGQSAEESAREIGEATGDIKVLISRS